MELTKEERDELEQLLLYNVYPESYDETPIDVSILVDILQKLEEMSGYDVTPACDICGLPQTCGKDDCWICPSNWNGETGNHLFCEETNLYMAEYYAQKGAG